MRSDTSFTGFTQPAVVDNSTVNRPNSSDASIPLSDALSHFYAFLLLYYFNFLAVFI